MKKLMLEKGRFVGKVMHLRHDVGAKQEAALAGYLARSAVEFTDTVDDIDRSDGSQIRKCSLKAVVRRREKLGEARRYSSEVIANTGELFKRLNDRRVVLLACHPAHSLC